MTVEEARRQRRRYGRIVRWCLFRMLRLDMYLIQKGAYR